MVYLVHLILVVSAFVAAQASQKCEEGWVSNGRSCYLLDNKHNENREEKGPSYFNARTNCDDNNAELAEISSFGENNFLRWWLAATNRDTTRGVWIGGSRLFTDNPEHWEWESSKTNVSFTDWVRKPADNEKCISMGQDSIYRWVPEYCNREENMKYLCEQQLCNMRDQCFKGSCYTISCAIFAPKLIQMYQYEDYEDGKVPTTYKCPKGSLVRIESKEENDFIKKFLSGTDDYVKNVWTAGYDENKEWKWQDTDAAVTFEDWAPRDDYEYYEDVEENVQMTGTTDPSYNYEFEKCIYLSREDNWAWKEQECSYKYPILCEYPDERFRWWRGK